MTIALRTLRLPIALAIVAFDAFVFVVAVSFVFSVLATDALAERRSVEP